jgi:hypothetical protein
MAQMPPGAPADAVHAPRPAAGTIGHVAHGKSTVVKAISGVHTVRFKNELERNITIKLGYANAKIYTCADEACPRPACYKAYGSSKEDRPKCDVPGAPTRRPGGRQAMPLLGPHSPPAHRGARPPMAARPASPAAAVGCLVVRPQASRTAR